MNQLDEHGGKRVRIGGSNADHEHHAANNFGIKLGQTIGHPDCPVMRRWVIETPLGSVRLHHFLRSDDSRALHDHPWWFVTIPLSGGYEDVTDDGVETMRRFRPRFRPAGHRHAVHTDDCWTFIVTGRKLRHWGFWTKLGFVENRSFFRAFGHAPCED
jgi:hypothetical protein